MAAVPDTNLTLADWAKTRDPDGSAAAIANLLSQQNDILENMTFVEANDATSHTCTVATGLPAVYWRSFNEGVMPSKGTTAQITEDIGMLQTFSEVDSDLAELQNDLGVFRLGQARLRLSAMNNQMASSIFYANSAVNSNKFMGLSSRFSDSSAANGQNIVKASGAETSNAQTSLWIVGWGDETVFGTFPKGSSAGLVQNDLGKGIVDVFDASGNYTGKMMAYQDHFKWSMGLVVKDWRYVVRVCNIDVAELSGLTGAQLPGSNASITTYANLLHSATDATYRIQDLGMVNAAIYCNRTVHSALNRIGLETHSSAVTFEQGVTQFGTPKRFMKINGIPCYRSDAIVNTEAVVA